MDTENKKYVRNGSVVLVDKELVPDVTGNHVELPVDQVTELKRQKEKKPMSEAKQAHVNNLIAMNKAKKEARLKLKEGIIPDVIPEGKVAVTVKRQYKKDVERSDIANRLANLETHISSIVSKKDLETLFANYRKETEIGVKEPRKPSENPRPKPVMKKKKMPVETSCDETEREDTEVDDTDDEYTKKYIKKAAKRLDVVRKIETQLAAVNKPVNRYANMSIF